MLIVSCPQMIVNYYQHGLPTPKVITGQGGGLFADQLYWGIEMQKYETYVGSGFPAATKYLDLVGQAILSMVNGEQTIQNYIKLVVMRYPLDFAGIYFRHFANMLDMRHPEVYMKSLSGNIIYPIINYSVLYIFTISFLNKILAKGTRFLNVIKRSKYIIILLIPSIAIIPGAVETRFAIMIHLLIYGLVTNTVKWKYFITLSGQRKIVLLIGYVMFLALMSAIGGTTIASLEYSPLLY